MKSHSKVGGRPEKTATGPETRQDRPGPDIAPQEPGDDEVRAQLENENADLKDRLLRALADAENIRRRSEREISDARQYAVTEFARDIANAVDNFERALANVSPGKHRGSETLETLAHGVELTRKELLRALEQHGVRKLDPLGERFDPNLHEALFEVPGSDAPAGTVAQVVSPGYTIGSRVLRPAKVGVAADTEPPAS